jgi:hypothetical protein
MLSIYAQVKQLYGMGVDAGKVVDVINEGKVKILLKIQ